MQQRLREVQRELRRLEPELAITEDRAKTELRKHRENLRRLGKQTDRRPRPPPAPTRSSEGKPPDRSGRQRATGIDMQEFMKAGGNKGALLKGYEQIAGAGGSQG
jgi:hypothetical protein